MRFHLKHFNHYYRYENGECDIQLVHTSGPLSSEPISLGHNGRETVTDLKKKHSR